MFIAEAQPRMLLPPQHRVAIQKGGRFGCQARRVCGHAFGRQVHNLRPWARGANSGLAIGELDRGALAVGLGLADTS